MPQPAPSAGVSTRGSISRLPTRKDWCPAASPTGETPRPRRTRRAAARSSSRRSGAGNAWGVISADPARDLVFVPTGSAAPDYYGGERLGENRYANSVVALRASTGALVWAFQVVHHDLWNYDVAAEPALVTIRHDGRDVPAVVVSTKMGHVFVLSRETGAPLFPVEERPVPHSDVPGEAAWPTQPFPVRPPPLDQHIVGAADAWGPTPQDLAFCRDRLEH